MKEKVEMETVTIQLPKAIMDFLRGCKEDIEDYLQYSIIDGFRADIETCEGTFGSWEDIFKRFGLEPIFKAFDISYCKPDC